LFKLTVSIAVATCPQLNLMLKLPSLSLDSGIYLIASVSLYRRRVLKLTLHSTWRNPPYLILYLETSE